MTDWSRTRPPRIRGTLGRPREFDKAAVLAEIMEVFWKQGYEGTSISDLVAATGIKKGSLYAAFGDKHAVYVMALELYIAQVNEMASAGLLRGPGPVKERLAAFLSTAVERVGSGDRRGCFLCAASTDRALIDAEVRRVVQAGLARLRRIFQDTLAGIPLLADKEEPRRAAAEDLLALYVGIQTLARAGHAPDSLAGIILRALRSLPDESRQNVGGKTAQ